jgi:hypothetical protein
MTRLTFPTSLSSAMLLTQEQRYEAPFILVSCRVKVACRKAEYSDPDVSTINIQQNMEL